MITLICDSRIENIDNIADNFTFLCVVIQPRPVPKAIFTVDFRVLVEETGIRLTIYQA
jgi:hypothetical protein